MTLIKDGLKEKFEKIINNAGFLCFDEQDYLQGEEFLGIRLYGSNPCDSDVIYRLENALSELSGKFVRITGIVLREK